MSGKVTGNEEDSSALSDSYSGSPLIYWVAKFNDILDDAFQIWFVVNLPDLP